MDSIKMPKADSSKNDSNLDEQLDKDLSQLGDKKIEVVESSGSGKRKMGADFIRENKSFLGREEKVKEIKDRQKKGDLISKKEASLLREVELDRKKSNSSKDKPEEKKDAPKDSPTEKNDDKKTAENENEEEESQAKDNSKYESDNEREYQQAKNAYEKEEDKNSEKAQKIKERMDYHQEAMRKEKQEKEANQEQTAENLREESEQAFKEFLEAEGEFQKTKNKRGLFRKTQALFGIGENKEGHINKEFIDQGKSIKELKENYRSKYNEFAKQLTKEKRQELRSEGNSEETINDLIGSWALTGEAISVKEKLEDGAEEERKVSLFEHINKKEKEILEKRKESLSEEKKGVFKKALEKYNNLSPKKKLIYGVGISSGIGATVMLAGGATIGVAFGYGAWRGARTLGRRVLMGAVAGATIKGINYSLEGSNQLKNSKDFEKTKDSFAGDFENEKTNLFDALDEYNKKVKKRDLKRKIIIGGTATVVFGSYLGLDALTEAGDVAGNSTERLGEKIPDDPDSSKFGSGKIPDDPEDSRVADKINEDRSYKAGSRPEAEKSQAMYRGMNEDNVEHYRDRVDRRAMYENYDEGNVAENLKLNNHFELARGGNVWNSLSEHFDGDRQEVGKILAGFRAETMDDLMKNHGMSEVQASQFIEWRYRHMNVGMDFELKDGKLEIPGFDSDQKIAQFGKTEFNNPDSMNDTMENAGKTRVERFNDMGPKKTVDISEPVETVEVLDPKISAQVDQNINNLVKDIYGGQAYEWDVMKNKNAWDIINGEYGNPIKPTYGEGIGERVGVEVNEVVESERGMVNNNSLDQAEINNRKELRGVLTSLADQTGIQPEANETVEQFIRRVEIAHYTENVSENIPGNATVEVPEPTETVEIMGPDTSDQLREIYGPQMNGYEEIKGESAQGFINGEYDDSGLSSVEINRNQELRELLLDRIKETGKNPEAGGNFSKPETIEEYLTKTSRS